MKSALRNWNILVLKQPDNSDDNDAPTQNISGERASREPLYCRSRIRILTTLRKFLFFALKTLPKNFKMCATTTNFCET